MQTKIKDKRTQTPLLLIILWGIYGLIYFYLKNNPSTSSDFFGWTSFSISTIATYIAVHYSLALWQMSIGRARKIFGLFSISILCSFISNLIYQISFNILKISNEAISNVVLSCYHLPYLAFLVCQSAVWLMLLHSLRFYKNKIKGFTLFSLITFVIIFLIFAFNSHVSLKNLSNMNFNQTYSFIELLLQLCGFLSALFCFICAKNRGIFYLAFSFIIIIGADLLMNLSFFAQTFGVKSIVEIGWILGVFFRIYGLYTIKKTKVYDALPESWVCD